MNKIQILDCTLRDGGYINNFNFGKNIIENIITQLENSNIDIIECGFLKSGTYDEKFSLFNEVKAVKNVIKSKKNNIMYVVMIQYGKISAEEIEPNDGSSLDGIRVTFHIHEINDAFDLAKKLMVKGYKIFMQPVGTISYSVNELIELIKKVNELNPYAFYIVDTLGSMYQKDVKHFFDIIDYNLNNDIKVGFHAHNNLQQAFSNALSLMQVASERELIIDSTVLGLGRGAGNLCTELVLQYINENIEKKYEMIHILDIIDQYISPMRAKYRWGYSAPYYLAATKQCHPNYATFLMNKQNLCAQDINNILNSIKPKKRHLYNEDYISDIYIAYKSRKIDDAEAVIGLEKEIDNKTVMLVAPGKSISDITKKQWDKYKKKYYVISINFIPKKFECDRTFYSNEKRFLSDEQEVKGKKLIVTSNVDSAKNIDDTYVVNYDSYLEENNEISDNAGIMCINLIKKIGVKELKLVGFDGFELDQTHNYLSDTLYIDLDNERINNMNKALSKYFKECQKNVSLEFVTETIYTNF